MAAPAEASISVPEVHCNHCVSSIEGALQPMEGIEAARVDLEARRVVVAFDPDTVDMDAITSAIEDQGYEVEA